MKKAVWNFEDDKSPRLDSSSTAFYKESWEILKDIMKMVDDFYISDFLDVENNVTFISRIPKKEGTLRIMDFRQIRLVSGTYKIISKIQADKMKEVLISVISLNQSVFIGGRQSMDGVLIANNALTQYERMVTQGSFTSGVYGYVRGFYCNLIWMYI